MMRIPVINPYVGPRSFTRKQRKYFFGRERESRDLLSLVLSRRLVLFYAQSGAGKTSLINTSLIPDLEENDRLVLPVGRVSGELPDDVAKVDNIFVFNLLRRLDPGNTDPTAFTRLGLNEFLHHFHCNDDGTWAFRPPEPEENDSAVANERLVRVLIIDQFEELLTAHAEHWEERADFFRQLAESLQEHARLTVVLTLREDYVAALDPYAPMLLDRMRSRFYMERMDHQAALQAVTKPAEKEGRPFTPDAAKTLVDNLSMIRSSRSKEQRPGQYIEPVQLQVVCFQLWQNLSPMRERNHNKITGEQVDRAGNIDRTLANFYEQALGKIIRETGVSELELRNWFERQLVTEARTRGTAFQGENSTGGIDNRIVHLLESRFLVRAESRSGATWYELVHDRFVEPILQNNQKWLEGQVLLRDAQAWTASGKQDKSLLYTGEKLENALAEVDDATSLEPVAMAFLDAGKAEQAAVEEKEATRLASERQRRRNILFFLLGLIGTVVSVVFFLLLYTANKQGAIANEQRIIAEKQHRIAEQKTYEARRLALQANYNLAKVFEEKALRSLEQAPKKGTEAYKYTVLFTSAALEQKIESNKSVLASSSIARLFTSEVFNLALAKRWFFSSEGEEIGVAFSPDGTHLASASRDGAVLFWDLESGRELRRLDGHEDVVLTCVAFSPDGRLLASASKDKTVRLWDLESGRELRRLDGHKDAVTSMSFSPDGKLLASASFDKTIRLWDLESGRELRRLDGHKDTVTGVAFSPDGRLLASASFDKSVRLWNIENGRELRRLDGHKDVVTSVSFSPDGTLLVSASGKIHECFKSVDKKRKPDSSDDKRLVSVSGTQTLRLWSVDTGKELAFFQDHTASIKTIAFSPDGKRLASISCDQTVRLWDVENGNNVPDFNVKASIVSFSPDATHLVSTIDNTVRLWGIETGKELRGHSDFSDWINKVSFSPDGEYLASISNKEVEIWNIETGEIIFKKKKYRKGKDISFSPDSRQVAWASSGNVQIWNSKNRNEISSFKIGSGAYSLSVSLNPDWSLLASATERRTIELWSVETGDKINVLRGHNSAVRHVSFSPDGKWLASASDDNTIRLWDVATGKKIQEFTGHDYDVESVSFNSNGSTLASGSRDKTVRLWDIVTGKEIKVFKGHVSDVFSVTFSHDGRWLASGSKDKTIRLWNIESGKGMEVFKGNGDIFSVTFSPDGRWLASGEHGGTVRRWDLRSYKLFLDDDLNPTPLYHSFMQGVKFFWQQEVDGLKVVRKERTDADIEKFGTLLEPPPKGQSKFDQVLQWAEKQQQELKSEDNFMQQQ